MDSLIVALFGASAVLLITAALWMPAHAREATMRRRMSGFVEGVGSKPSVLGIEVAGRVRRRTSAAPAEHRSRAMRAVEGRIARAQLGLSPEELLIGVGVVSAAALTVVTVVAGPTTGIAAALAVPLLALAWLARRAGGVQGRFSEQLADTVALLASSVRTGHSVIQALEYVSREAPEPTRSAFALVVREIGLGASLEDALARLLERYPSEDLDLVITAVNVHSSIGGSLVRILDTVAETIRERSRMIAEVKALTAQQRYSAYVLALLPVFILIGLRLISPDYVSELFRPSLRIALIGAGALVAAGFVIMQRMSNVD